MNGDPLFHLSRVAGLTAYSLLWLNVCIGLGLRTSLPLPYLKRWRVADLHQFMGLLSMGFLGLHIVVLVGLKQQPFAFAELWVPQLRSAQATLGVCALYLTLLVIVTSYLRRYLNLLVWRSVHGLSVVAYALGLAHGLIAGPDGEALWTRLMYWSTNALLVALFARRIWLFRRIRGRGHLVVVPGLRRVIDRSPA